MPTIFGGDSTPSTGALIEFAFGRLTPSWRDRARIFLSSTKHLLALALEFSQMSFEHGAPAARPSRPGLRRNVI
jgi:hypothetical protein